MGPHLTDPWDTGIASCPLVSSGFTSHQCRENLIIWRSHVLGTVSLLWRGNLAPQEGNSNSLDPLGTPWDSAHPGEEASCWVWEGVQRGLTSPLGRTLCSSSLNDVPILLRTTGGSSPGSSGYSIGSWPVSSCRDGTRRSQSRMGMESGTFSPVHMPQCTHILTYMHTYMSS